jgi:hypothetical protein
MMTPPDVDVVAVILAVAGVATGDLAAGAAIATGAPVGTVVVARPTL